MADAQAFKQETRIALGHRTSILRALRPDYSAFVRQNHRQHCVLRTKAEIPKKARALIQAGDDDDVYASAFFGSIVLSTATTWRDTTSHSSIGAG